jgi:TolA-binding protein
MKTSFLKTFALGLTLSGLAATALADDSFSYSGRAFSRDEVIRIEVGKQRGDYSREELERRVWQLERAVWQLQQRVFDLESTKNQKPVVESWICTVSAMGGTYTGNGSTKAEAMANSINSCKKEADDNGFFCKNPKCEK